MFRMRGGGIVKGHLWILVNKGSRKTWKEYNLQEQVALDFNLGLDTAVLLWACYFTSLSLSF